MLSFIFYRIEFRVGLDLDINISFRPSNIFYISKRSFFKEVIVFSTPISLLTSSYTAL